MLQVPWSYFGAVRWRVVRAECTISLMNSN